MFKNITKYLVLLFVILASGQAVSPISANMDSDPSPELIQQDEQDEDEKGSEKTASFRVEDRSTSPPTVINPNDTVDFGLASLLEVKQRVIYIVNTSTSRLCVDKTSIVSGVPTFSIGFGTGCPLGGGGIFPGQTTSFSILAASNTPGTYNGIAFFASNQGSFFFKLRVRVLEDGPALIVKDSSGTIIGDSSTVNYGSIDIGQAVVKEFTVENNGDETLNINPLNVTGEGFSLSQSAPSSIDPGGEGTFKVRLLSQTGGNKSGEVEIFSNDANDSLLDFNLTGMINVPDIQVVTSSGVGVAQGSTFNIGTNIPNDTARDQTYHIRNKGSATLIVNSIDVSGEGFSLISPPSFPLQIGVNGSDAFTVRLQSQIGGAKSGSVIINNNDPDDHPYSYNLSGSVQYPPNPEPVITVERVSGSNILQNSTVNLGNVLVNSPHEEVFIIRNIGSATLSNINVSISGEGYSLDSPPPSSLSPLGTSGNTGIFVVLLMSNTTGIKPGDVSIQSNAPVNNPFNFNLTASVQELAPEIRVLQTATGVEYSDGSTFTFPATLVDDLPTSRLFSICNDGTADLIINNPNTLVSGSGFLQIGDPPTSPVVPGSCTSFRVRFHVANLGNFSGTITIENNDANENPYDIFLQGTALPPNPPEIRVLQTATGDEYIDGSTFTFPDTPVAELPISRLFDICNDGTGDLIIDNPNTLVSGSGFLQIGNPPSSIVSLGTCTSFRVRFHVANSGNFSGSITIQNNDPDENPYEIFLVGTATN